MGGRIAPRYNVLFKYVAAISLTPHGCPGRQLPTLNMGSDTLIFISQSHGKRRGSSSFSPLSLCRDFYAILAYYSNSKNSFLPLNGQC